jgi:alpha-N-arabinofuranosidase
MMVKLKTEQPISINFIAVLRFSLIALSHILVIGSLNAQSEMQHLVTVSIYPDSVLNDVTNHPLGINLDYLMDDDKYLRPKRRLADALKAMGVKYLRYPGGNKSDFYFFSKPPYDKSIPTLARTGKDAVGGRNSVLNSTATDFKNDVLDFDEFMTVCKEVGAEPVIVVAADEYLVNYPAGSTWSTKEQLLNHAAEWVRYANIKKKYHIKYWLIGNESWNKENENSTAEIYAQDVVDFSKAMKAVDPNIHIVPNGNSDQFWKTVLTKASGYIDEICISNYPVFQYSRQYYTYRDSLQNLMGPVQTALLAIDKYASAFDKKKLKVIVAEYGPFDWANTWPFINNMGYNLVNFEMTGEQLLEPRIDFSCFWNTRWITNDYKSNSVFDALDRNGNFNANGNGLAIWGNFLGDKMVKTTSSPQVKTFASFKEKEKKLFLYMINKSDKEKTVNALVHRHTVRNISQAWELVSTGPEDTKPVWRKLAQLKSQKVIRLNPTSITVIEMKLK